ncbi:MAG: prepilin-type N-terminal cleavage/methylation domain-containing protein [Gammaproteobacteria bacterium]
MHRQRGITLIEALVTLVLVLVGLLGAARLQAELLAASAQAKAKDEATALALDKLAEFHAIADYAGYRDRIVPGTVQLSGLLHTYALTWTVEHNPAPDYKRVDVTIQWPADTPAHTLRIQTLIPGHEPGRFAHLHLAP